MTGPVRKPWFGPKRIGFGLRPQTWQGWLFVLGIVAAAILIAWSLC
jgi:preprotein translocase subunit SecE